MSWDDILKISTEDAIQDAERYMPEEVSKDVSSAMLRMYERMLKELWALADENADNELSSEINRITNRKGQQVSANR